MKSSFFLRITDMKQKKVGSIEKDTKNSQKFAEIIENNWEKCYTISEGFI